MMGSPKPARTTLRKSATPRTGMSRTTSSDVTANGTVSVTHSVTANAMMPRHMRPSAVRGTRLPPRSSGAGDGSRQIAASTATAPSSTRAGRRRARTRVPGGRSCPGRPASCAPSSVPSMLSSRPTMRINMPRLIGAALVCLAATLLFAVVETPLEAQAPGTAASADPLDLFAKIYPVFAHPRCINCHGVVQTSTTNIRVLTGVGHRGGAVTLADDCGDCHHTPQVLVDAWQFTAPSSMSWVGLNQEQLCTLQSQQVRSVRPATATCTISPRIRSSRRRSRGVRAGSWIPAQKPPLERGGISGRRTGMGGCRGWVRAIIGAACSRSRASIAFYVVSVSSQRRQGDRRARSARQELKVFRSADGTAYAMLDAQRQRHQHDGLSRDQVSTARAR